MRAFLSSLTAALLALHAVLGCCWHHAHHCEQQRAAMAAVASPDNCNDDHASGCGEDSVNGHDRRGSHHCQEGPCLFLGPTRANPRQTSFIFSWGDASVAATVEVVPARVETIRAARVSSDALLPPLRLHLMDCVLLI